MSTINDVNLSAPGNNGYRIKSDNKETMIYLDGVTYDVDRIFGGIKVTKVTDKKGVEHYVSQNDNNAIGVTPYLSWFGTITPLEREALSVIRNLYQKENDPDRKLALKDVYTNTIKAAKYGYILDASTKDIPKIAK